MERLASAAARAWSSLSWALFWDRSYSEGTVVIVAAASTCVVAEVLITGVLSFMPTGNCHNCDNTIPKR